MGITEAMLAQPGLPHGPFSKDGPSDPVGWPKRVPQQKPLPTLPAVRRDLSLVVPESMRYEQIESLIRGLKLDSMDGLEYVTTYRGKPLEKGHKSVTVTLAFRSPTTTLTGEHVDAAVQRAIDAAGSQLGATLRA